MDNLIAYKTYILAGLAMILMIVAMVTHFDIAAFLDGMITLLNKLNTIFGGCPAATVPPAPAG